ADDRRRSRLPGTARRLLSRAGEPEGGPGAFPPRPGLPAPPGRADGREGKDVPPAPVRRVRGEAGAIAGAIPGPLVGGAGPCVRGRTDGRRPSRRRAGARGRRLPGRDDRPVRPTGVPSAVPPRRRPVT